MGAVIAHRNLYKKYGFLKEEVKLRTCKDCIYYRPNRIYEHKTIVEISSKNQLKKLQSREDVKSIKKIDENKYEVVFIEHDKRPFCSKRECIIGDVYFGHICPNFVEKPKDR